MNTQTAPDYREGSDSYARTIYTEDRHRVALCRDGIQYLLQRRIDKAHGPEWKSLRFCTTGNSAARDWRWMLGLKSTDPVASQISQLPSNARIASQSLGAEVEADQPVS